MKIRVTILAGLMSVLVPALQAQDLHFSQFMNSPLVTNPANTGFIPDGDYRIGINYRNQWSSIMSIPYKTMSAFGDVQVAQSQDATGWLGVGGLILRDVAGSGSLTVTVVPSPFSLARVISPRYASTISWTRARPTPRPWIAPCRAAWAR